MPDRAKLIALSCDEATVRAWAAFMRAHLDEVRASLAQEGVRHEQWHLRRESGALALIGVMEVEDVVAARQAAAASDLGVDRVHRRFKRHWRMDEARSLDIDPSCPPSFPETECLLDLRF